MGNDWLASITDLWLRQVEICRNVKYDRFGKSAERIWSYMGKSYKDLAPEEDGYGEDMPQIPKMNARTRINKTQEFVSLMLPRIHEKVPSRVCRPRTQSVPPDIAGSVEMILGFKPENLQTSPLDRVRCWLMEKWLNYTPNEYDLFRESRTAIIEALVKGRGVAWVEMIEGPHGAFPATFYDSVDNLFIDADCKQFHEANFIIRKRTRSVQIVAEEFGILADDLRGIADSHFNLAKDITRSAVGTDDEHNHDVCVYYEVWSRIGFGHRMKDAGDDLSEIADTLDSAGQYVYLVVMPGIDYPLNLPRETIVGETPDALIKRVEWPIAFHAEAVDPWPCTVLDFLPNCEDPWATSILEAALPLQTFLDNFYTYCMARVKATTRDIIIVSSQLAENVRTAITSGYDQEIVEHDGDASELSKLVHVIEFPEMNKDGWAMIQAVERKFEDITGMTPELHGASPERQMRSSAEAQARQQNVLSRPEDYAGCVMAWQSKISAKEGKAARLYVTPDTVAPLFGETAPDLGNPETAAQSPLSWLWSSLVNTDDPSVAAAEIEYTCEAGAGSRMNKQKLISDASVLTQQLLPTFLQFTVQGNVAPYNRLMELLADAYEMPLQKLMLDAPQPLPSQAGMPPGATAPTEGPTA